MMTTGQIMLQLIVSPRPRPMRIAAMIMLPTTDRLICRDKQSDQYLDHDQDTGTQ